MLNKFVKPCAIASAPCTPWLLAGKSEINPWVSKETSVRVESSIEAEVLDIWVSKCIGLIFRDGMILREESILEGKTMILLEFLMNWPCPRWAYGVCWSQSRTYPWHCHGMAVLSSMIAGKCHGIVMLAEKSSRCRMNGTSWKLYPSASSETHLLKLVIKETRILMVCIYNHYDLFSQQAVCIPPLISHAAEVFPLRNGDGTLSLSCSCTVPKSKKVE